MGDPLQPGTAAYLAGNETEAIALWTRAFNDALEADQVEQAARAAHFISQTFTLRGEGAPGQAWLERGQQLVDGRECGERALLMVMQGVYTVLRGDPERARDLFAEAIEIGERTGDSDARTAALMWYGQMLARLGERARGVGCLDQAMLIATTTDVSPITRGLVYCTCLVLCQQIFDVRRAQEWTNSLTAWCDTRPGMVPFRGQCLVHRSELSQLRGEWADAMQEALNACARLSDPPQGALGLAMYQRGELHRLLGQFEEAESAYRHASAHGQDPQPGLALLRLAEGRLDAAVPAIKRAVSESFEDPIGRGPDQAGRGAMLEPMVEIFLAAGDVPGARDACEQLDAIAARVDAALLRARAARAWGAVLLAEGVAGAALEKLRIAWTGFRDLGAPYEVARTRVLLGVACAALDDVDTASMHFDAARACFEQLGAAPDLARLERLAAPASGPGPLSAREREVLELIAAGNTNREIANALVISERTVARHLSNIFTKLGVSTRTAASAYAFKHGLVRT